MNKFYRYIIASRFLRDATDLLVIDNKILKSLVSRYEKLISSDNENNSLKRGNFQC